MQTSETSLSSSEIEKIRCLYLSPAEQDSGCEKDDQILSKEELQLIPHLKRFLECIVADPKFRASFYDEPQQREDLLMNRGIHGLDSDQLLLLVPQDPEQQPPEAELLQHPLISLWRRWSDATAKYRESWCQLGDKATDPSYRKWRQRQQRRCASEMGSNMNEGLVHSLATFELNKGCSMNCPFCGIAAEPLQDVFPYTPENARLFREIVQVLADRFGEAAKTTFCYWATDPSDNPDYLRFVKDMGDITGNYPQSTTAAPLRNLEWTQKLLEFRRDHVTSADRFSILSSSALRRVHATFSAEDLAFTEMVCIGHDSKQPRTRTGRYREHLKSDEAGSKRPSRLSQDVDPHEGTIACVSGFLINMVERRIKLISPYKACQRYPLGYRVFEEGCFNSSAEVATFIDKAINLHMNEKVQNEDILTFRPDLDVELKDDGFYLRSPRFVHKMVGEPYMRSLGQLIASGSRTFSSVTSELVAQGENIFLVTSSIQKLFERGLLTDEPTQESEPVRLLGMA